MTIKARFLVITAMLWCSCSAYAYELGTHARLTYKAYEQSVLFKDTQFLKNLGIESTANSPFGDLYYDISGSTIRERQADPFEANFMVDRSNPPAIPPGTTPESVPGWLLRGAIREDDAYGEDNPQDDTDPANAKLRRPLHHFFDPIRNRGLDVFGIELLDDDIHTAPAWGLGTTNANAFSQPHTPEVNRRNHFTVLDAREAMYRALTGKKADSDDPFAATKEGRNKYWATTFRALGDAVHLIQDMGQPPQGTHAFEEICA